MKRSVTGYFTRMRTLVNSCSPAFYNAGVQRRRAAHERERWLSAVLIVTAIVGVSAAIRFWPVSLPQRISRPLASRALIVIDAPVLPLPGRVVLPREPEPSDARDSSPAAAAIATVAVRVSTAAPEADVEPRTIAVVPPTDAFLLASGRLDLPLEAPSIASSLEPQIVLAGEESHALMELPAVAVTRVVTVAGRGIRNGVRATTAVFRAAFSWVA